MKQLRDYPNYLNGSVEILATKRQQYWSFNDFFNRVKSGLNVPIFNYNNDGAEKTFNNINVEYKKKLFGRLKGEHFVLRLTNSIESRFKYIFGWTRNNRH
jgi:hypothetical protein